MSVMSGIYVKLLEKLFERKPEYNTMSFEDMIRVSTKLSKKAQNCMNEATVIVDECAVEDSEVFNYEKYARAYDYLATGYSYGYESSLLMYLVNSCQTYKNEQERRKAAKV